VLQYELAPIFENANVATDHNMLSSSGNHELRGRTDMVFSLAPREAVRRYNGSGKHPQLVDVVDDLKQ
jgi:glutamine synthetase